MLVIARIALMVFIILVTALLGSLSDKKAYPETVLNIAWGAWVAIVGMIGVLTKFVYLKLPWTEKTAVYINTFLIITGMALAIYFWLHH
jgi:hypothetical protein